MIKRAVLTLTIIIMLVAPGLACSHPICRPGPQGPQGEQGIQGEKGDTGAPGADSEESQRQTPVGVGVDFMLLQTSDQKQGLEIQYRFDEGNNEHSAFVVYKINLYNKTAK